MRRLLIVCVLSFIGFSSTAALAVDEDSQTNDVAENDVAESEVVEDDVSHADTATVSESIDPLADLTGRPDAPDLSENQLWDDFDEAFGRFQDYLAESDEAPAETQTGFRSRVRAIGAAMDVRDLLDALLAGDSLTKDEALGAQDSFLTVQQVMGSMMVDIGECARAVDVLRTLENNPETHERALLLKGTQRWLGRAQRCVERQDLEQQIAEREFEADEEELQRLRARLETSKSKEAEAEEEERRDESDELTLSRDELLGLLRQSAASRHERSALDSLFSDKRKGLPTHEYGITVYGGMTHFANFAIRALLEPNTRVEPKARGHYGGSFFVRKKERKRDISLNYDYTSFDLSSHWWLRKNKPRADAKWLDIGMLPKHTITVGIDRNFVFGKKERFHFHIGGMFGLMILPNHSFPKEDVDPGACLVGISKDKNGHIDRFVEGGACYDKLKDEGKTVKLPPVLPSIGLRLGARYVIADRVQVGVQGGFQDGYFFANGVLGVIVGKKYREGERP